MTGLFLPLHDEERIILHRLSALIEKVFPLPERFRHTVPKNVAELSRLLTSARTERGSSYLGKPALLSAYLRYFLPWNIYRLCRLLSSLQITLKPSDTIIDLGSGPLTLAVALWISRPDLRKIPLDFKCIDKTAAVMEAGKKLFMALSASGNGKAPCPWKLTTIKGEIKLNGKLSVQIRGKPSALTTAVNIYNEIFWNFSPADTEDLKYFTERQASLLSSLTDQAGSILVVEPGIPRSGEFISSLRSCLMERNIFPLSPCTHSLPCPFPGGQSGDTNYRKKEKWCHFAFDTDNAPEELHRLSAASGIPKERAVLSFLLASQTPAQPDPGSKKENIRIISDSFPLDSDKSGSGRNWGRYGCSESGMILVTGGRRDLELSPSGALEEHSINKNKIDSKSGALVVNKDPS